MPSEPVAGKRPGPSPRLVKLIDAILAEPEQARFWAEHCGWEPGIDRCGRTAGCDANCWVRRQLDH